LNGTCSSYLLSLFLCRCFPALKAFQSLFADA
jgi:hypothetical protein